MAMNKKEQAEMDAMRRALVVARAFNRTENVSPDLPVPAAFKQSINEGWAFNSYNASVRRAWSTSVSHGDGPYPAGDRYRSGSQNGKALYSTKLLALRGLRHTVENECANKLADIDEMIAEELAMHPNGGTTR